MMRSCVKIMLDRVLAIAVAQFVLAMAICGELQAATADEEFSEATRLTAAGAFADSVAHWKKAEALFEEAKNFPDRSKRKFISRPHTMRLARPGWLPKPLCVHRILRC